MKKHLSIAVALLLALSLFTACAGSADAQKESNDAPAYAHSNYSDSVTMGQSAASAESAAGSGADITASSTAGQYGLKIVYNAYLDIETLDFDKSCADIEAAVKAADGYLSSTEVSGGQSYNGGYSRRSAYYTARIPAEKFDGFLSEGSSFGNIVSSNKSSDDITSTYIDTQARLDSLKQEEARLLELLQSSGSLEDLIAVEDRLSNVRYQIESYTSQMNTYDDMVSFCTVTISLGEVNVISVDKTNFGTEVVEALKGSGRAVLSFLRGALIALIYALPFLAIAALVAFIVLRATKKKRAERKQRLELARRTAAENAEAARQSGEASPFTKN